MIMLLLGVLAVCLSAVLSAPSLDAQLDKHWELWKNWHDKKYHYVRVVCLCTWPHDSAVSSSVELV